MSIFAQFSEIIMIIKSFFIVSLLFPGSLVSTVRTNDYYCHMRSEMKMQLYVAQSTHYRTKQRTHTHTQHISGAHSHVELPCSTTTDFVECTFNILTLSHPIALSLSLLHRAAKQHLRIKFGINININMRTCIENECNINILLVGVGVRMTLLLLLLLFVFRFSSLSLTEVILTWCMGVISQCILFGKSSGGVFQLTLHYFKRFQAVQ